MTKPQAKLEWRMRKKAVIAVNVICFPVVVLSFALFVGALGFYAGFSQAAENLWRNKDWDFFWRMPL